MPEQQIAAALATGGATAAAGAGDEQPDPDELRLWAWHVPALRLFRGMKTQWRTVTVGQTFKYTGLDYAALPVVEQRLALKGDDELLECLQVMEAEGLLVLND